MLTSTYNSLIRVRVGLCTAALALFITSTHLHAAQPGDRPDDSPIQPFLAPTIPTGAVELADITSAARPGDTVTFRGRIPDQSAFDPTTAAFTLVDDAALAARQSTPPTTSPPPPTTAASDLPSIRVELAHKGQLLSTPLNGRSGLKPGDEVFVTGVVRASPGGPSSPLTVSATSLHVPKGPLPVGFFPRNAPQAAPPAGAPAQAIELSEYRANADPKVGDAVVLRGRVGGSPQPFVAGRAVLTLAGRAIKACNEIPGDHCPIPWDYCCVPRAEITANSVTVRVVDRRGAPLRTDLKGRLGMKELSEVEVRGTIAAVEGKGVIVNADSMSIITP